MPGVTEDEARLLKEANDRYPVTVEELRRVLHMRPGAFDLALRSLVRKGLIVLEPLEGATFVRPMAVVGSKQPPRPPDDHDPAFA
jgi:DNA-binding MarR family transcriptional regulator